MVKKAIIPAAGLGTRFLPATKAVPKELLPIVDTPSIQLIVQEVVNSGIETLILITGKGKSAIEDHFDLHPELQSKLEREGKTELASRLQDTTFMVKMVSVRQQLQLGLGHAVLCAKEIIGNEPFAVLLGDDLVDAETPCTKQMIDLYNKYKKSVVALMEVPEEDVSKFGICEGEEIADGIFNIKSMIEKPSSSETSSRLAIVGRYLLTPEIFDALENTTPGKNGEIQLTDALAQLSRTQGVLGYKFKGDRYDAGDQFGYLKANIAFAMKRPEIAPRLVDYLQEVIDKSR